MSRLKEKLIQILSVLLLASSCSPAKKTEAPPAVVKKPVIVAPPPVAIIKTADDIFFENVYRNDPNSFSKIFKSKKVIRSDQIKKK